VLLIIQILKICCYVQFALVQIPQPDLARKNVNISHFVVFVIFKKLNNASEFNVMLHFLCSVESVLLIRTIINENEC
jgi:hypothetical protein